MAKERVIQIGNSFVLTNKGRLFEYRTGENGATWYAVELPKFEDTLADKLKGAMGLNKVNFIEPVSDKERFDNAKNIGGLLNK